MQRFCNSWHVRNLLVMVLTLNKCLKLAESIVSLHPHQAAQVDRQLLTLSTVHTASSCVVDNAREDPFLLP